MCPPQPPNDVGPSGTKFVCGVIRSCEAESVAESWTAMQAESASPSTSSPGTRPVWWALGAFAACVAMTWTAGALLQTWRFVPGLVLTELLFFATPAYVALARNRQPGAAPDPCFRPPRPGRDVLWTAGLAVVVTMVAVAKGVAVRQSLGLPLPTQLLSWPLVLALAVPAPLAEELLFRPVLQRAFATLWRPGTALLATAMLFGLVHGSFARFPETFLLGLFSGVVFLKTGNYWLCVLFHALANVLGPALWPVAAQQPVLFHPFIGLALTAAVLALAWHWRPPDTRLWTWRAHLRWALFGRNESPPNQVGGRAPLVVFWAGTALMTTLVAFVTVAEVQHVRAVKQRTPGGPLVRQRDEWRLETNAVIVVRSRVEFEQWPATRTSWTFALGYPDAKVTRVEVAGEPVETRVAGAGTFELVWPEPLPPPGTVEVYWEMPVSMLEAPERGFQIRLQALVPVNAFALRLALSPGCGYVFERAPDRREDTVFSTSGNWPARRIFGTCGLGLRRTTPAEVAP